jgi:hypothetical protein
VAAKRDAGPGGARHIERFPHGRPDLSSSTAADGFSGSIGGGVGIKREYFSGSLVETKKTTSGERAGHGGELGALKRSSPPNCYDAKCTVNPEKCTVWVKTTQNQV